MEVGGWGGKEGDGGHRWRTYELCLERGLGVSMEMEAAFLWCEDPSF